MKRNFHNINSTIAITNFAPLRIVSVKMEIVIDCLRENYADEVTNLPKVNKRIIKSALVYQYLMYKHKIEPKCIEEIIQIQPSIGMLGPGNGCLTRILEFLLSWSKLFCRHACLHDAYGRFFQDYRKDVGYLYAIRRGVPGFLKTKPLFGHLSGLYLCSYYDF